MVIWQKICSYRTIIIAVLLLIGLHLITTISNDILYYRIAKLVAIPIVLTIYFMKMRYMVNIFFTIFLLFFLGDAFSVFNINPMASQLSQAFYIGSYLLLIFVLIGKIKHVKFEGIVTLYLILVFLLNIYFLYALYEIVGDSFSDSLNLALCITRGIALIVMSFVAFTVYLSRESKQSIIFLAMSFCFVFSDVLYYINSLYVYYWLFEFFDRGLHLIGLVLLLIYVTNHHRNLIAFKTEDNKEKAISKQEEGITA